MRRDRDTIPRMPNVDFAAASTRHLRDALLLYQEERYDNAFYLAGYVVECALKAVVKGSGLVPGGFGHKLLKLEGDALQLAIAIAPATVRYRPPRAPVQAVSSTWSVDHRYFSTGVSARRAEALLSDARMVWESCIGEMLLDGVLQELS